MTTQRITQPTHTLTHAYHFASSSHFYISRLHITRNTFFALARRIRSSSNPSIQAFKRTSGPTSPLNPSIDIMIVAESYSVSHLPICPQRILEFWNLRTFYLELEAPLRATRRVGTQQSGPMGQLALGCTMKRHTAVRRHGWFCKNSQ